VKNITREKLPRLLQSGKFVSVKFRKKDGTIRNLTGRTGVAKHTTGEGLKFDPAKRGMFVIWETTEANRKDEKDKGYRMVTLDNVLEVRADNESFIVV